MSPEGLTGFTVVLTTYGTMAQEAPLKDRQAVKGKRQGSAAAAAAEAAAAASGPDASGLQDLSLPGQPDGGSKPGSRPGSSGGGGGSKGGGRGAAAAASGGPLFQVMWHRWVAGWWVGGLAGGWMGCVAQVVANSWLVDGWPLFYVTQHRLVRGGGTMSGLEVALLVYDNYATVSRVVLLGGVALKGGLLHLPGCECQKATSGDSWQLQQVFD